MLLSYNAYFHEKCSALYSKHNQLIAHSHLSMSDAISLYSYFYYFAA